MLTNLQKACHDIDKAEQRAKSLASVRSEANPLEELWEYLTSSRLSLEDAIACIEEEKLDSLLSS